MAIKARYFKVVVDDAYYNSNWYIATIEEFQVFGSDGTTNLALNKTATASGSYNAFTPNKAVDGVITDANKWASQHELANPSTQNVWWQVDLGQVYKDLTTAEVSTTLSGSGYAALKSYRVFVSVDNSYWALAYQVTNAPNARRTDTITLDYPQNTGKPMARWAMQETTNNALGDSLGGSYPGTAVSGNARRFNGTSDSVTMNTTIIPLGAKTMIFKFRKSAAPASDQVIFDNSGGTTGHFVYVEASGSIGWVYYLAGVAKFNVKTLTPVCDNKWHEIKLTWDGSTVASRVRVHVDGDTGRTGTSSSTDTTAYTNALRIGAKAGASASMWVAADLDDLWISGGSEVNGGSLGTVAAWWKMDDATASTFTDSGQGNAPGTITGTTVLTGTSAAYPIIKSDGQGGYCRTFNGRSDYISFTTTVLPLGAKSIRFKVRIPSRPTNDDYILDNTNTGTGSGTIISVSTGGRILFHSYSAGANRFMCSPTKDICDGVWHDILCIWDGTTNTNGVKVYIDDMVTFASQTTSTSRETATQTNNLTLGVASNLTANTFLAGDLKDFQINAGTGTERFNPLDLQVGDFISASYAATAINTFGSFTKLGATSDASLTTTPSTTPSGSFYFMCVDTDPKGRKVCIADRNIQSSLAWDVLNTAGITAYSGIPLPMNTAIVPYTMNTAATSPDGGVASASSQYGPAYKALFAFDGSVAGVGGGDGGWVSSNTSTHWLEYAFPISRKITSYSIGPRSATVNASPKDWTFEAYNETTSSWVVLDTRTGVTNWVANQYNYYTFTNTNVYKRYRINITLNNGNTTYHTIGELRMFENAGFNTSVRLLTGGSTVAGDKENDWDQYIVNSTLGGTTNGGDNAIWNWSGVYSTTSTTSGSSGNRTIRGNTTAVSGSNITTAQANGNSNFRPMLIVENSFTLVEKILVDDGGMYKTFDGKDWIDVGTTPTDDDYIAQGMNDLSALVSNLTSAAITMTDVGTIGNGKRYELVLPLTKYGKITGITINKT